MSFPSQPRKKGTSPKPQKGSKSFCGSSDSAENKRAIASLLDRIKNILDIDSKGVQKAATILSHWISKKS